LDNFESPDFGRGFFVSGGTWLTKASPSCAHQTPRRATASAANTRVIQYSASNPRPACDRLRATRSTLCDLSTGIAPQTCGESGSIPVSTYSGPMPASLLIGGSHAHVRPDQFDTHQDIPLWLNRPLPVSQLPARSGQAFAGVASLGVG